MGQMVTSGYFAALGVAPVLGRGFRSLAEDDAVPGASTVAVVSYRLWRRRLRRSAGATEQTIGLNLGRP